MRVVTLRAHGDAPPAVARIGADSTESTDSTACALDFARLTDPVEGEIEGLWVAQVPLAAGEDLAVEGAALSLGPEDAEITLTRGAAGWQRAAPLPASDVGLPLYPEVGQTPLWGWSCVLGLALLLAALLRWPRRAPAASDKAADAAHGDSAHGARPATGHGSSHNPVDRRPLLAALAAGLTAAVVGTWPMAVSWGALVQRNFDAFGGTWMLWRLGPHAREGLPLPRFETATFLLLGGPLTALADPAGVYHLLVILGVTCAFVTAEWVARRIFEVPPPASWIAGLGYALCPLAGTAIVEGHGGWLVGPGLPLMIGALFARPRRRPWRWAALVVGAGALAAGHSGYLAVMAGIAVLALGGGLGRPVWRVALLSLPAALAYAALVVPELTLEGGGDIGGAYADMLAGLPESDVATLDTLAGLPPGSDLPLNHARRSLLFTLLVGGVLIPLARRERAGALLALTALTGVALSLGPALLPTFLPEGEALVGSMPYGWIVALAPALAVFRFPARFLWLYYAAAAVGAARTAGWLTEGLTASRRRAAMAGLAALTAAEVAFFAVRPWEPRQVLREIPGAYAALTAEDRVLDLWPSYAPGHLQAMHLQQLGCYYQTRHGAGLAAPCASATAETGVQAQPFPGLGMALAGDAPGRWPEELARAGITAVAWHPDAFPPEERGRLRAALDRWWALRAESTDAGEAVRIYAVGPVSPGRAGPPAAAAVSEGLEECEGLEALPRGVAQGGSREPLPPWSLGVLALLIGAGWVVEERRGR